MKISVRALRSPSVSVIAATAFAAALAMPTAGAQQTPVAPGPGAVEEADEINDPIEPINRVIFEFNEIFQRVILYPATSIYEIFIPPPVREAVANILSNLKSPVVIANELLQGEPERAWTTTQRFVVNSTLGIGGIIDQATDMGLPKHSEDFGQTLAVWGVPEMFYVVLPVFGPSSPRDAVGKLVVDPYADPLGHYLENTDRDAAIYARMSVDGVTQYGAVKDELQRIKKTSVDYYAAIRSLYRQKRNAEIRNGAEGDLPPIPDLTVEWKDDATGTGSEFGSHPILEIGRASCRERV